MFTSLWRRIFSRQSRTITNNQPSRWARPRLELLEDRVTPSNYSAAVAGTTLTLTNSTGGNADITIVNAGFQLFTVNGNGSTTVNGGSSVTTVTPITAIVIKMSSGNDNLTFDGAASGPINLTAGLTISGTGGNKTIAANNLYLLKNSNLKITLAGPGSESTTFTDCDISGSATISHTGSGDTIFNILTSSNNATSLNKWGSLSITNGAGADANTIQDTMFTGSVSIINGAGAGGNTSQFGGSHTVFSDGNYQNLLTIGGSLTVTTANGHSDTEVYDYNVKGTVTLAAGAGIAGQSKANLVGIENNQNAAQVPVIGAAVISGGAVTGLNPGLTVNLGTDGSNDYPLVIQGGLTINATGNGSAGITLNDLTVGGSTTITLASSTDSDTVNILGNDATSTFGPITINAKGTGNNTINVQAQKGTLKVIGGLGINLGNGADAVNVGASDGNVTVSGVLGSSSTGGRKTITVQTATLGGVNFALVGGSETTLFTDTNVTGPATITHSGAGDTSFTINTSSNNANALNTWKSLTITNGAGSDLNTIYDTDFGGNVTINNGAGAPGNTSQFGGTHTVFSDLNNEALLNIHGNLTITNGSGQSDIEVIDYNVYGNVTLNSGSGIAGQSTNHLIGLENGQTASGSGIPAISGNVSIIGVAVSGLNPGLIVNLGIDSSNNNYPLIIGGNLNVTANGGGIASLNLNDLTVANGTTTITLGAATHDNTVSIQGSSVAAVFNNFNIFSYASGANIFNIQDQAGTIQFGGTVNVKLGSGADTVNLAADSGNTSGVSSAVVEFHGRSTFDGGAGIDLLFGGTVGTNVFYNLTPIVKNF